MKTIIITGANRGIGFHCALRAAQMQPDRRIVLACRNPAAGELAAQKIRALTGHGHVISLPIDLASLPSVQRFVDLLQDLQDPAVEALINNAGILVNEKNELTEDGFEKTFATNHLGPFYLTLLLSAHYDTGARIIFVTSEAHHLVRHSSTIPSLYASANLPTSNQKNEQPLWMRRYAISKLCNILTAYKLSELLADRNIRVNACNPGLTPGTGLIDGRSAWARFKWQYLMPAAALFSGNMITKSVAGDRLAELAFSSQMQYLTGVYYSNGRLGLSSKDSYNRTYQEDLWNESISLTGLPLNALR